jgi:hypothetical protein
MREGVVVAVLGVAAVAVAGVVVVVVVVNLVEGLTGLARSRHLTTSATVVRNRVTSSRIARRIMTPISSNRGHPRGFRGDLSRK